MIRTMIPRGGWRRPLRREAVKPAAAFIGVTLGVAVLRRRGDANLGLPFAPRIARRVASLIPAAFVPASFASSRIGAASRRGTERFGDHDLTAAPRRRELGLPFSPRIAPRVASPIPAAFVLGSFAPSRIGAPSRRGTERFGDHGLTSDGLWDKARGCARDSATR
jgi:hypothetical protein